MADSHQELQAVHSSLRLLTKRRFLPLFITQFLGAFNDNLYKMSMLTLIVYRLAGEQNLSEALVSNMAAGLFMLPFFLMSAFAGQLADKYEKSRQIRWIKVWEIGLMCLGAVGFYTGNIALMLAMLFGMGLQSTFFGPIKYAILPEHLHKDELLAGNSLIEAGTFLSILLGMVLGPLLVMAEGGIDKAVTATLTCAVVGFVASCFIPKTKQAAADLVIRKNIFAETRRQFQAIRVNQQIFLSVMGISWFWMFGSVFMAQITPLAKSSLYLNEGGMSLLLALFTVGIAAGSLLCNKLLKGQISARFQNFSLLGVVISTVVLYLSLSFYPPYETLVGSLTLKGGGAVEAGQLIGFSDFLSTLTGKIMAVSVVFIALAGGVFIVPLYARMQNQSDADKCSRTVAANNVLNSLFIVGGAVAAMLMIKVSLGVELVILLFSLTGVAMMILLKPLLKSDSQTKQ